MCEKVNVRPCWCSMENDKIEIRRIRRNVLVQRREHAEKEAENSTDREAKKKEAAKQGAGSIKASSMGEETVKKDAGVKRSKSESQETDASDGTGTADSPTSSSND